MLLLLLYIWKIKLQWSLLILLNFHCCQLQCVRAFKYSHVAAGLDHNFKDFGSSFLCSFRSNLSSHKFVSETFMACRTTSSGEEERRKYNTLRNFSPI
jgi:hypothetical protein